MSEHRRLEAREVTDEEADALVHQAFELEREIKRQCIAAHAAYWDLAASLWRFHEIRGWTKLGYEKLEEFLAQPEIGISRSSFFRAVQAWRDLVVVKEIAAPRLSRIQPSKVQEVLPAIMRGNVKAERALDDAEALGFRDLREKYRTAGDEPARVKCPTCSTWVPEDRLSVVINGTARRRVSR